LRTWSKKRRVIGKAEYSEKGPNTRFIVTSLIKKRVIEGKQLYEEIYCARGDMENRIKEQQLYLFADTTPCHKLRENQLRLWLSSVAYVVMHSLRTVGLAGIKDWSQYQCETIRNKVFKIAVRVTISVRRIYTQFNSSYPFKIAFFTILNNIKRFPMPSG
jgi:hypothetical protein